MAQVEIGSGGAAELAAAHPELVQSLLTSLRRRYTRIGLSFADSLARRWLEESANPYLPELKAMSAHIHASGLHLLSLGLDICCTSAAVPAKAGGFRLVRVLDWPLAGTGSSLTLARQYGPAGSFLNLTWPGFTGVLTGLAEGRFAAAINQPPMGGTFTRLRRWRKGGLPPAHLLRMVFETAPDYDTARRMLLETRLASPAFFTLVGPGPSEGCIIERTPFEAAVRPAPAAVASHWMSMNPAGAKPPKDSHGRQAAMERLLRHPPNHFHWLAPPVLNKHTRMVALAEPATGFLRVQGYEKMAPATRPVTFEG